MATLYPATSSLTHSVEFSSLDQPEAQLSRDQTGQEKHGAMFSEKVPGKASWNYLAAKEDRSLLGDFTSYGKKQRLWSKKQQRSSRNPDNH